MLKTTRLCRGVGDNAARALHHRTPRGRSARCADRHSLLRRLPLRHPPGPRRMGRLDLPDGAGPRDRRQRGEGRRGGREMEARRHGRASAVSSIPAASAKPAEQGGAVLRAGHDPDLQRLRARRQDADLRRLLDAHHRGRGLRAAHSGWHAAGSRGAAAMRRHHHLFAAAPFRRQGRATRSRWSVWAGSATWR